MKKIKKIKMGADCWQIANRYSIIIRRPTDGAFPWWRDVRAVEGTGLENRRRASVRGFESHSLRHIFNQWISYLQKYPRGRRGSPAKGVGRVERREGSNPSFSAKRKALIFNGSRLFSFCGLRKVTVAPFLKIFLFFKIFSCLLLYSVV